MKVLVTGGSGSLGHAVTLALVAAGDTVLSYDLAAPRERRSDVLYERGDVTDGVHLVRTAKEFGAEVIVHLAALLLVQTNQDPGLAVRVTCGGMVNALEAARILGIPRVVWASSGGVFGGYLDGAPIANDAAFRPNSIYSAAKLLNEHIAAQYADSFGIDTIGLRFTLMTGPGRQGTGIADRLGQELIDKPARGKPGRVPFGDDTACWLWLGDAAAVVAIAVHHEGRAPTRVYNVGGEPRSIRDAARIVRRLLPTAELTLEPGKANLHHPLDTTVIERELGWRTRTPLEDQLRLMLESARAAIQADAPAFPQVPPSNDG